MMLADRLVVCESFFSIQGEGPSVGRPAIFLRLGGCNLTCPALGCDTRHLWTHGTAANIPRLLSSWAENGWLAALSEGAHLVITGGEPLLQRSGLRSFLGQLKHTLGRSPFTEVETNATCPLDPSLDGQLHQVNASPKLPSAGNPADRAYRPEVLAGYARDDRVIFKFVLMNESDMGEILQQYCTPFDLSPQRIWLMPGGTTAAELAARSQWIVPLCRQYRMNYSPRIHIHIWGNTPGV